MVGSTAELKEHIPVITTIDDIEYSHESVEKELSGIKDGVEKVAEKIKNSMVRTEFYAVVKDILASWGSLIKAIEFEKGILYSDSTHKTPGTIGDRILSETRYYFNRALEQTQVGKELRQVMGKQMY